MDDLEKAFADKEHPWAIVLTAGGKYIGQLTSWYRELEEENPGLYTERGAILETVRLGHLLEMSYAQEFHSSLFPRGTPQGINFERLVQAYSIGRCLDVERTVIHLQASDILFFDDMSPSDRAWHQSLVRAGIDNSMEARAQAAGILTGKGRGGAPGHA